MAATLTGRLWHSSPWALVSLPRAQLLLRRATNYLIYAPWQAPLQHLPVFVGYNSFPGDISMGFGSILRLKYLLQGQLSWTDFLEQH